MEGQKIFEKSPFFIMYDSRSGSTFLANLLVEQFGVVVPPESRFLPGFLQTKLSNSSIINLFKFLEVLKRDNKFLDWSLGYLYIFFKLFLKKCRSHRDFITQLIFSYYDKNKIKSKDISLFGFKKGSYISYVDRILEVFPNSKIIYLIRDGRAVFSSKKTSLYSETKLPFETNPERAADIWIKSIDKFEYFMNQYPNNFLLTKYESIIEDETNELKRILKFLDLEDIHSIKYEYKIPEKYSKLHDNVKKSPIISRISAWKNNLSNEEIIAYEKKAKDYLVKYGYEIYG